MRFLPLVLKNVFRKKTRSVLTILSILLPLFVICILGTLLATLDRDPSDGKGMFRLTIRHRISITNFLPEAYLPKIRQLPGVKEVTVLTWFGGQYIDKSAKNFFARFATDPETFPGSSTRRRSWKGRPRSGRGTGAVSWSASS